ncbi:flagellar biosynthetic protein FliO [Oceanobacillus halophilus]|uniref:flagellar biosynthetic protein FliO n=1 Tax=Oceanobacillus halophilus TaxID=930130 RepID=UPI001314AA91|nr:flagellar biosynthetic protein FliO [Oceanobacillus halophilus]
MFKKILYFTPIVLILFSFHFLAADVLSAPANVIDCLEDEQNCEETSKQGIELDNSEDDIVADTSQNRSLLFSIIKLFFALVLVLALIYILLKFLNKRNKLSQQVKAMENLGGISLGQNKSIQIIRIGSKFYLIGVGENVELLQELADETVKKEILDRNNNNPNSLLSSFIPTKSDNADDNKEFKHLFSSELAKLKQTRKNLINNNQKEDHNE